MALERGARGRVARRSIAAPPARAASRRERADHLLLEWCQQSGRDEEEVAAPSALAVDPRLSRELGRLGLALDRLLRRASDAILARARPFAEFELPAFPLAPEILGGGPLGAAFFWSRFDVFERADGGLAVLEYNCDKPAGQREIWAAESLGPARSNPNRGARSAFERALLGAWARHAARAGARRAPRVAILADPAHGEEFRLAYLYGRAIDRLGWEWVVAGPHNLGVDRGRPVAFGAPIDVALRQYPAEFLHELPEARALLLAARAGRLLWLNDPRAVVAQSKGLLALLWKLASDGELTGGEAAAVRRWIPPTGLASAPGWLERAAARREDWVIKPALGRYSERVALGALASPADWDGALARARAEPHGYVVQAYVPPRRRWLPGAAGHRPGYVNWGVYLAGGKLAGLCPRLQPTPLTEESAAWWAPLVLQRARPERISVLAPRRGRVVRGANVRARRRAWPGAGAAWQAIADRHALAGYTSAWTGGVANFSLAAIGLGGAMWDELAHATRAVGDAVGRVLTHLENRPELLAPLGIPAALAALATRPRDAEPWSFLSRLDWARTRSGWKLMEINSDTPAGLWEAGAVSADVARLHAARPLGAHLDAALEASWRRSAAGLLGPAADGPLTVAMVAVPGAGEDQDQLRAHRRAASRALPGARFEGAAPEEIEVRAGRAWLRGRSVDLLFRYYPMDWLAAPRFGPLLALIGDGALPMLPPARAVIPQSKAFLALVWELLERDFFPPAEAAAVRRHVARTALDARRFPPGRHVVKPYLEREGAGVRFAAGLSARERRALAGADVVYQEELDLARARIPVATAAGWREESRVLVFGVYLAGGEIAGLYTRAGARVTGREAVFVPALLRD